MKHVNTVLILGMLAVGAYLLWNTATTAQASSATPTVPTASAATAAPVVVDSSGSPAAGVPAAVIVTPPPSVTPAPAQNLSFNIPSFSRIPLAQDTTTGQIVVPVSQNGTVIGLPVTSQPVVESLNYVYDYLTYLGQNQNHTSAEWTAFLNYAAPNVPITDPGTGTSDLETYWLAVQGQIIGYVKGATTSSGIGWIT